MHLKIVGYISFLGGRGAGNLYSVTKITYQRMLEVSNWFEDITVIMKILITSLYFMKIFREFQKQNTNSYTICRL